MTIFIIIYLVIFSLNIYYIYRPDFKKVSDEHWFEWILALFVWPLFLLRNLIAHWWLNWKKKEKWWFYQWWDVIEYQKKRWIYLKKVEWYTYSDCCILIEWDISHTLCREEELSFEYRSPLKQELQDLEKAMKLQKEAEALYVKLKPKKKTIFNS